MRLRGALVIVALCAFPAHGDDPTMPEIHALTPIDSLPTRTQIENIYPDPVARLREIALLAGADFGARLRAISALPQFCDSTPSCKDDSDLQMHPARAAIREVIGAVEFNSRDGKAILQLRAGIEALGAVKSDKQSDVDLLLPFLAHASRDVRATTARALQTLCLSSAIPPLRERADQETSEQVRLAISAALGELAVCSP